MTTPTTDEIRWEFSYYSDWQAKERGETFDAWLAAERERIWDEGARATEQWLLRGPDVAPTNPYRETT